MRSPRINGEGEFRGQPANPCSPGKIAVKTERECVCVLHYITFDLKMYCSDSTVQ